MTSPPNFGWTDFYMEFADKLLAHKNDRAELFKKTRKAVRNVMEQEECYLDRSHGGNLTEICPFSVMGTFNRRISDTNRKKIADEIGEFLGVSGRAPDSFDGIPILNPMASVVFHDVADIVPLWQVFEDAIRLADSNNQDARQSFLKSYDRTFMASGIGSKLTIGFFWIRPHDFLPLDSRSRNYVSSILGLPYVSDRPTGPQYLELLNSLNERFIKSVFPVHSFQELSWKAYELPEPPTTSIWQVRAQASDGSAEDVALNQGLAIVHWGVPDLTDVADLDGIKDRVRHALPDNSPQSIGSIASQLSSFLWSMNEGDIVVTPLSTRSDRVALGRIAGQYAFQQIGAGQYHTRPVDWVRQDVPTSDFDGIQFDRRTVFHIQDEEAKQRILALLEDTPPPPPPPTPDYTLDDILQDGCFLEEPKLKTILSRLQSKKNLILQGPPGTGKTWLARRLAYALIGEEDDTRVRRLQFHPNLSYEDFIRGYRPNPDGKLDLVDGPFLKAVNDATNDPDNKYVIVIEEINRGNPAQIFGEMLTLLESDKRKPEEALTLAHSHQADERVYIPPNLYVIGTMNVADRSIALVDLALRRRFAFIDLVPVFGDVWRKWVHKQSDIPPEFLTTIENRITTLNDKIAADPSLGPQFQIGHSYLTPTERIEDATVWFTDIVETEIAPLLSEYWFDNATEAETAKSDLLAGLP